MRSRTFSVAGLLAASALVVLACGENATVDPPAANEQPVEETGLPRKDAGAAIDDASTSPDATTIPVVDALGESRDRLLTTYLAYLKASQYKQTNGLAGGSLTSVCDLWRTLAPSPQSTFLTLTARLQGSKVASDGASMLAHVTKLYRVVGGDGSTTVNPGSCGGGENNRMIVSMDMALHDALRLANANKGANGTKGKPDIADQAPGTFWRDSHDLGGAHSPFDQSDETDSDLPRGQVQFFKDPTSAKAKSALGRKDLEALVDPLALELDQDYDCVHNSNPLCSYTFYGNLCALAESKLGAELYVARYGAFDPAWLPTGCTK